MNHNINYSTMMMKQTNIDTFKINNSDSFKIELSNSNTITKNTLVTEVLNGNKTFRVQIQKCNMR